MIFYTQDEANNWVEGCNLQLPDKGNLEHLIRYPKAGDRYYGFAQAIADKLFCGDPVLLIMVEWSIWSSTENLHLYYRLRNTYNDFRLLHEAPGHFFLKHEKEDLISFLQLSMLNGWGGYLTSQGCDLGIFFSHDNYVALYGNDSEDIAEFMQWLIKLAE